jgi:hypothetical protein
MRKTIFAIAFAFDAIATITSCTPSGTANATSDTDTTMVDSTSIDSVTVAADTVAVDSAK